MLVDAFRDVKWRCGSLASLHFGLRGMSIEATFTGLTTQTHDGTASTIPFYRYTIAGDQVRLLSTSGCTQALWRCVDCNRGALVPTLHALL